MSFLKGWFGEKKTAFKLWAWIDSDEYEIYHNLIIPSENGTAQIDHLLVSEYGIFIVETKNMSGWIYGTKDQAKWTQTHYQKKTSFQNPLRQTYRQKKFLAGLLKIRERNIHTIIYFTGECELKTKLPPNVMMKGLKRFIESFEDEVFSEDEISTIIDSLDEVQRNPALSSRQHIMDLKKRHSSTTVCPNCGKSLVKRTARSGPNAGSSFLGCSGYPKCRFTKAT